MNGRMITLAALALTIVAACDTQQSDPAGAKVRGAFDVDVASTKIIDVAVPTDTGVASARFASFTPGFAFRIAGINTFARTRSGTLAGSVKIGSKVVVSSLNFGIDSIKAMTLLPDSAQGSATDTVNVFLATTGAGTVKQGHVIFQIKPRY